MAIDSFRYKNPFDITTAGFSDNGELLVQGDFSYPNSRTPKPSTTNNENEQGIQGIQGVQDTQSTYDMQSVQGIQETQEDGIIRVSSISEAKNIFNQSTNPSTLEFIIENVVFAFRNNYGRFMFVKDDSGGLLIYDNNAPVITTSYNEGDLIDSIQGRLTLYQGMHEFIPTKNSPYTTGIPVKIEPIPTTINDIESNYEQYESQLVTLNNVVFVDGGEYSNGGILYVNQNEKTFQCWDRFGELSMIIQPNVHANITGFIGFSDKWGYHIWPRSNNDIEII